MEEQRTLVKICKPSLITDYYAPRAKVMEQIVWDEDGEGAWWEDETLNWIGLRGGRSSGMVTNERTNQQPTRTVVTEAEQSLTTQPQREVGLRTGEPEAGLKMSRTGGILVTEDPNTTAAPVLDPGLTTPPQEEGCTRTDSPRDGLEQDKTGEVGLKEDSTSALWGDSGDEEFMEQETYAYMGVTSLNYGGAGTRGVGQTPLDVKGTSVRRLTT